MKRKFRQLQKKSTRIDAIQNDYINNLYQLYVNKKRDENELEPLENNMKLNKLAVGVIGREKFCGQVLKSKRFKSYDINCLTMQKSSFESEPDMIDKVLAN